MEPSLIFTSQSPSISKCCWSYFQNMSKHWPLLAPWSQHQLSPCVSQQPGRSPRLCCWWVFYLYHASQQRCSSYAFLKPFLGIPFHAAKYLKGIMMLPRTEMICPPPILSLISFLLPSLPCSILTGFLAVPQIRQATKLFTTREQYHVQASPATSFLKIHCTLSFISFTSLFTFHLLSQVFLDMLAHSISPQLCTSYFPYSDFFFLQST